MAPTLHSGWWVPLLAQGVAGSEPERWWDVVRHDVIPVAAAYVVLLGLLVTYHRAMRGANEEPSPAPPREQREEGPPTVVPGWGDLVRFLAGMVVGGYGFFLAIVVVFYFILGGEDVEFIRQALVEGSALAFGIVVPVCLLLSGLDDLRSGRGPAKH